MARRLENWFRLEVRATIQFLWAKNVSASPIYSQIVEAYGEEAMSKQRVAPCNTAGRNQPSSSTAEINTARIE
ncbi:hypothetical protein TNCV_2511901 [Trichonephila clavipes]|nr:hypothetical protein TNCV_2511901 [Trichonephila clavipes]